MTDGFRGTFTTAQTQQLLAPIKAERVLRDPRGNSHVSQQDVTAHLIRVFGFGNFMTEILDVTLVFEDPFIGRDGNPVPGKWNVCYRAAMRVSIFDKDHNFVASYEDVSCGDAQNQNRQDAHDLALKSAVSTAKKRCCINLGDQYGLSLYNKGQLAPLVRGSIILPPPPKDGEKHTDITEGVPQQESLGHDEVEKAPPVADEEAEATLAATLGATKVEQAEEVSS